MQLPVNSKNLSLMASIFPFLAAAAHGSPDALNHTIKWTNCSTALTPRLECGTIGVPVDWQNPHGPYTTLGLQRVKALNTTARIGPLFFNPGGPGGVATQFITGVAEGVPVFSQELQEHFDLIGVDPRGVGTSTPVKCDPEIANRQQTLFPKSEEEWDNLLENNRAFAESCFNLTGPLFAHMDTTSVARDLEAVRVALGSEKLNWLGLSYGSQIGVAYAELFPTHIRAMALDGNMDHSAAETYNVVTESSSYEVVFTHFAEWCSNSSDCALQGQDVLRIFDDLVLQADSVPIPAPYCEVNGGCRPNVTGEDLRFNVQGMLGFTEPNELSGDPGWPGLGIALNETLHGNATLLSSVLATIEVQDIEFAGRAVECLDWTHSTKSYSELLYKQELLKTISPHTQGATQTWQIQTGCLGWPFPIQNLPHYAHVVGAPPILMINSFYDPETSIVWANALLAQLPSAVMAVRDGDGHTSYLLMGESSKATDDYLVNLTLPVPGTIYKT